MESVGSQLTQAGSSAEEGAGTKRDRLPFVDAAKGLAMICIACGHFGFFAIDRVVFTFHVPLFYCLAGYFMSDRRDVASFARHKARTLLLPYYVIAFAIVLATLPRAFASGDPAGFVLSKLGAVAYASGESYTTPFAIEKIGAPWFLWACFWGELFLRLSLGMHPAGRIAWVAGLLAFSQLTKDAIWLPLSIQAGAAATLFLYAGYLVRRGQDRLRALPPWAKALGLLGALAVWAQFIWNFQSFWLVSADLGRGAIDVVGSLCACAVVLAGCYALQRSGLRLADWLARFGRYTLLFLGIHSVELAAFPWGTAVRALEASALAEPLQATILIAVRLMMDFALLWLLLKSRTVCRVFGYQR